MPHLFGQPGKVFNGQLAEDIREQLLALLLGVLSDGLATLQAQK